MSVHEAPPASDLIETIVSAAADAIRNQTTALADKAGHVRSVTLELQIANNGAVIDSTCWIERRGIHRTKGG